MNSFEVINTSNDVVVIDQSMIFYYIGQATYQSTTFGIYGGYIHTYFISSTTKPMLFVELLASVKTTILDMRVVTGGYSIRVICSTSSVPRLFNFTQSPVSSIGNPSDYSFVLYDSSGNITCDGSRDLLYTPCLIDYTTAGTSQTGTQMTTITMPDTLSLSYSGTAPSSLAVFCPAVSYKTIYAFDSTNAWYVYTTMHSGMVLDSGVIKSCWVKYGAGNAMGIPFHDSANVGLTCQMPVIDVSRYA